VAKVSKEPIVKNLHVLPETWEWAQMIDIGAPVKNAIVDGPFGSNLKVSDYVENGPVPVLTTKNLTGDYANVRYITQDKFEELKRSEVKPKDILMAKIGSCGKTGIYPDNMPSAIIPANLMKITVHPDVQQKYVYYYFDSLQFKSHLKSITKATAQPAFGVTNFKRLPFPLAPPEQQKRIVAKIEELFSHIDAGIEALKKAKQLLKQYRQSVLKAAVTGELTKEWREANKTKLEAASQLLERILKERRQKWEEQQLEQFKAKGKIPKDDKWKERYKEPQKPEDKLEIPSTWVCSSFDELVIDSQNGISKRRGKEGLDTHVLRLADITNGEIDESTPRDILLTENERDKYLLKENDLLCIRVNGSNDLVGRMIKVSIKEEWGFCDHFIRFRLPVDQIEMAFVELFFDSQYARDFIDKNKVSSAGQNTVSQSTMGRIVIPIPTATEQKQIMERVIEKHVAIKRLDIEIDNQLKKAEKNKQSILAYAFQGKITNG